MPLRRRPLAAVRRIVPPVGLAGALLLGGCGDGGAPPTAAAPTGTLTTGTPTTSTPTTSTPTTSTTPTTGASTTGPATGSATASAAGRGTPLGVFEVTCHTGPGVTASGRPSSRQVVSVDRRLFPFGTRLFIEEVGLRVAADTGPSMVGRRLDIWEPSVAACTAFGRKQLRVWRQP